jgi:fructose-1-phosphate kinase PfkB-like protein
MNALPHFFTLTGNLLAERTLEFDRWAPGRTQRAQRESFQVGGKGINVSKMLNRLGAPNTALCFPGGATGTECEEWLQERSFAYRAFESDRPTRAGTVVRAVAEPETTFLGPDAPPSAPAIRRAAEFLDAQPAGQVLAVCGSLPGWDSTDFDPLRAAFERWLGRGQLVVDTYGAPLGWFAARPVALIKINAVELRTLAADSAPVSDLLVTAHARWSARCWVISDGGKDVWFRDEGGSIASLTPPEVREVSPTGSGDVLLAGLLVSLFHQRTSLRAALQAALPLAAANAAHPGIAEFP